MAANNKKSNVKSNYSFKDLIEETNDSKNNESLQDIINVSNKKNGSITKKKSENASLKKNTVKVSNNKTVSSNKVKKPSYDVDVPIKNNSNNKKVNNNKISNNNHVLIDSNDNIKVKSIDKSNNAIAEKNDGNKKDNNIPLKNSFSLNNDNIEVINKEKLLENNEKDTTNERKSYFKRYFIILSLLLLIIFLIYLFLPRISLNGGKVVTIDYNQKYVENGYKASFLFKDVSNNVKIRNNIKEHRVGNYQVIYYLDYKLFKFKKTRTVKIVDKQVPVINIDNSINLCPNDSIENVKFDVIDEYDGDITNKAIKEFKNNKLIIRVSDSSSNEAKKEVNVNKSDTEKPSLTLKGSNTIYLSPGGKYHEPGYEATDNCDGDLYDKVSVSGNVGSSVGTYKITYTVTDSSNNSSTIFRTVIVRNNLYNSGTIGNGVIYLTFDDGPSWGTTNIILDVLKEEGVKATFFVTCNGPDELIRRMYNEGHTVALHTATHNYSYVYSSIDNYFDDLYRVENRVKNLTGYDSKIIRFPGGSSNTVSRQYKYGIMSELTNMVLDKGYRYFDWNIDSNDAGGARSSNEVYNNVTRNLSKYRSNVVLMHDIKTTTRDAIRNIIIYGKNNGYSFDKITMDTYMIRHGVNN